MHLNIVIYISCTVELEFHATSIGRSPLFTDQKI